eukprot:7894700-Alexandrium_andersonii.AAC.1
MVMNNLSWLWSFSEDPNLVCPLYPPRSSDIAGSAQADVADSLVSPLVLHVLHAQPSRQKVQTYGESALRGLAGTEAAVSVHRAQCAAFD